MNSFWHNLPRPFFILAPMEAVTDVVFRHVVAQAGSPDVWFSEFTNATGWVHAGEKAIGGRLIKTDDEQPIVAQIWGGEPGDMEQLAVHCRELGYHGIDINMGCPAKSAVKSGGSALIRNPELAAQSIAAAKTAGLPVSVKTRLGYTHVDEWRDWLAHLLRQDIVNLTIHLRTKKEMSKVPAHHELIDDIVALRDDVAPQTLLTINGDIRDRQHGLELIAEHRGVNGVMIGRGIFHNPFAFAAIESPSPVFSETSAQARESAEGDSWRGEDCLSEASSAEAQEATDNDSRSAEAVSKNTGEGDDSKLTGNHWILDQVQDNNNERPGFRIKSGMTEAEVDNARKQELFALLHYHLDLFDEYQPQLHRPFETLKRFFKIYVKGFDGAAELRDKLMHTKSTDEVRAILAHI